MNAYRSAVVAAAAAAVVVLAATAQTGPSDAPPPWTRLTPDGQPDLQGTWVNFDSTPFEVDQEAPSLFGNPVNPPAHWADHDSPISATRRSMVVDPRDGRVPVMKWAEERRDYDLAHLEDAPKQEKPWTTITGSSSRATCRKEGATAAS